MPMRGRLARRALLALAVAATTARAGLAAAPARGGVRQALCLAPGPAEGPAARLIERLAESCARAPGGGIALRWNLLGGPDGVTAANRFAAEAAPDGRTLLLVPGAAAQARLAGDPRARFDAAGWLPVLALAQPAVVAIREPAPGQPVRFALGTPDGPAAAVLLGLELLGIPAVAVPGLAGLRAEQAVAEGTADGVLLQGEALAARAAALGARPWFTLEPAGTRDAALPETPSLLDLPGAMAPLRQALEVAAACARLQVALVLPALTPAPAVVQWRAAGQRWLEEETRAARGLVPRAVGAAEAQAALAALAASPEAGVAYRDWLLQRFGWRAE
jgi:hypothetical protein